MTITLTRDNMLTQLPSLIQLFDHYHSLIVTPSVSAQSVEGSEHIDILIQAAKEAQHASHSFISGKEVIDDILRS